jgi:hypothetical protein
MSEEVFRWVITVAVILACLATLWQAAVMAILLNMGKKAQKAGKEAQNKYQPLVESIIKNSSKIVEENRPRIADMTAETLVIIKAARQHADRIGELIDEVSGRARARIVQIDETVGHTVEQVEQAGDAVKSAVMKPVKEVNGLVAGLKAALSTYAQGGNRNSPERATQDEEMFI